MGRREERQVEGMVTEREGEEESSEKEGGRGGERVRVEEVNMVMMMRMRRKEWRNGQQFRIALPFPSIQSFRVLLGQILPSFSLSSPPLAMMLHSTKTMRMSSLLIGLDE